MKLRLANILIGVLFVGFLSPLHAQVGRIWGIVKDENGNPVPNAQIEIQALNMKRSYKVKTKKDGKFLHAGVHFQGTYRVVARKEGYQGAYVTGVRPSLGDDDRGEVEIVMPTGEPRKMAFEYSDEERAKLMKEQKDAEKQRAEFAAVKAGFDEGVASYNAGNYDAAIESFNKVIEKDPEQPAVWAHLGNSYEKLKKYEDAEKAYNKAIELKPEEAAFYQNLGNIRAEQGDSEGANAAYEKAAQLSATLDPSAAATTYYNMGVTYINNGDNEAAADALNKAIAADPNHAESHYQLGIVMLGLGKMDDAIKHLNKYVELAPNGPNAETAKALVQQLKGGS